MRTPDAPRHVEWRIGEQRFSGSVDEVARELDRLILALLAFRRSLGPGAGAPTPDVVRQPRWWSRVRRVVGLVVILCATPAFLWAQDAVAPSPPHEPWRDGTFEGLQEVTLTFEQSLRSGLLLRTEYRHQWSDTDYFPSDSARRDRQPTLLVGAVWWFGSTAGAVVGPPMWDLVFVGVATLFFGLAFCVIAGCSRLAGS